MNNLKSILCILIALLSATAFGQKNQNQLLKQVESGSFSVYKSIGPTYKKKWEAVKKPWPIIIEKSNGLVSSVTVKRAGILDEKFSPDISAMPAYFKMNTLRLSYVEGRFYYYRWDAKRANADIVYVLVKKGQSYRAKWDEENLKVAKYIKSVIALQGGARANIATEKKAQAEAERRANSLQDKIPVKLEVKVIQKPEIVSHFGSPIKYGVIATLKNGQVLKTKNLGGKLPWSDFIIQCEGGTPTAEEVS